jgi:hypothetical protein
MKFFQIALFYDQYLADFNRRHPGREVESFERQQQLLFGDGFSACHYFAEGMAELGHETMMVVANDPGSQLAWRKQNPFFPPGQGARGPTGAWGSCVPTGLIEILLEQIRRFEPDVLYLQDPISLDSRFVAMIPHRPKMVVAWRASVVPRKTDWSDIDLLVSNHTPSLLAGKRKGARWQEFLQPGFPVRLARKMEGIPESREVAFSGQLSTLHRRRTEILTGLAMDQMGAGGGFGLHYAVNTGPETPAGIDMHAQAPVYGREMYEFLRSGRICLNIHAELATQTGGNMRVFEATALGCFLLTDLGRKDHGLFRTGHEIETFRNRQELHEKVLHYLKNPEARIRIAQAGQARCLRDFSLRKTAENLEKLLQQGLAAGRSRRSFFRWVNFWPGLRPVPAGECAG